MTNRNTTLAWLEKLATIGDPPSAKEYRAAADALRQARSAKERSRAVARMAEATARMADEPFIEATDADGRPMDEVTRTAAHLLRAVAEAESGNIDGPHMAASALPDSASATAAEALLELGRASNRGMPVDDDLVSDLQALAHNVRPDLGAQAALVLGDLAALYRQTGSSR